MSFVAVVTDRVAEAAKALDEVKTRLSEATSAAAAPTTGIAAAARDEVSSAIAALFSDRGREFQALHAEAEEFHQGFVRALGASAAQYATAESANAAATLFDSFGPAQTLFGPLVWNVFGNGSSLGSIFGPLATPWNTPFTLPVTTYPTPFGPIVVTLYGNASGFGTFNVTGGSLQVPAPITLAVDAVGPFVSAMGAVDAGGAAYASAMQSGNAGAAVQALAATPGNAAGAFLFGQGSVTYTAPMSSSTGYTSASLTIPTRGLFAPLAPVMASAVATNGTVTSFPMSGAQFGGLFAGIGNVIADAITGI